MGGLDEGRGARASPGRAACPTADKAESQEICFVPDGDYARFVEREAPEADRSGPIVDAEGRELGRHEGVHRFTVGQRRGLGLALGAAALRAGGPARVADGGGRATRTELLARPPRRAAT